ncbi:MAG TPA: c-type cytochrome biogenesis protein CcsB [Ktedonobacteraceae bacterium]|nr:c-type cytochrome biogenesis protein CcsB [Ktedonobacteraceae bacterium]
MQLLSIAATSGTSGLGTASVYFFSAGLCMLVVMTLAYLWYTIGAARLAKTVGLEKSGSQAVSKTSGRVGAAVPSVHAASAAGAGVTSIATLTPVAAADMPGAVVPEATKPASEVVLREQPDGEVPIALNSGLIAIGRVGTAIGWMTVFALTMSQIFRTIVEQHAPWSNLYEFSISFTIALLLCYLIFEARFHERVRAWGLYVCLLAVVTVGIALFIGSAYNLIGDSTSLIPALQDQPILTVHVSMAIFAYALFSVAFGAGLIILVQGGEGRRFAWLPSAEAADELGYKAVIVGFPLLALTLILGAYWANYAWGSYWSWDPKETSALITWLIYAVYLHARGIRGWRGKRAGWLLTIGFAATLFTYYGVSFFVPSLHSYAK